LTPGALNECSMLSIRPNLAAWAWDYRSVGRLLKVTVGGSGPYPTMVLVRLFNLLFIRETDDPEINSLPTIQKLSWSDLRPSHPIARLAWTGRRFDPGDLRHRQFRHLIRRATPIISKCPVDQRVTCRPPCPWRGARSCKRRAVS
jgi:hypothetical protein